MIAAIHRGSGGVYPVERAVILPQLLMARIVKQQPVKPLPPVPLDELPELAAHEYQLLARMGELIAVQRAERAELLVVVAEHLVYHRLLTVYNLVV